MSESLEKAAMEKSGSRNYAMSNKRHKKRKLQSNKSYEGETEFGTCESFRINTYFVSIDSLLSELDKQTLAYENHDTKFGLLTKLPEVTADSLATRRTCRKML
jgi:hypothetical protein